jgi:hypothetical protein
MSKGLSLEPRPAFVADDERVRERPAYKRMSAQNEELKRKLAG